MSGRVVIPFSIDRLVEAEFDIADHRFDDLAFGGRWTARAIRNMQARATDKLERPEQILPPVVIRNLDNSWWETIPERQREPEYRVHTHRYWGEHCHTQIISSFDPLGLGARFMTVNKRTEKGRAKQFGRWQAHAHLWMEKPT